jgi:2-amino-4-hydroxy-6-hydroxymethyldihydropteridine diphosphokinase
VTEAWLGIGSNVGERPLFVRRGIQELETAGVKITGVSGLYETSPLGGPPQRSFINIAARVETDLTARELLELCQGVERKIGRDESAIRWGPRVIDIDILLFGDEKISEPDLEVPHPRMATRRFVLVPLLEIDPELSDPWGARYADVLDEAEGDVERLEDFGA